MPLLKIKNETKRSSAFRFFMGLVFWCKSKLAKQFFKAMLKCDFNTGGPADLTVGADAWRVVSELRQNLSENEWRLLFAITDPTTII